MSSTKRVMLCGLTIVAVFVFATIAVLQEEVQASPAMTLSYGCACVYACEGDIDNTGEVDGIDLNLLLEAWGCTCSESDPRCFFMFQFGCMIADFNDDGEVNVTDLLELLANWGTCP